MFYVPVSFYPKLSDGFWELFFKEALPIFEWLETLLRKND